MNRMAGLLQAIKQAALPAGKAQKALTVGPDLVLGGLTAASMPEGTTPLERLLIGGETAVGSFGAGVFGRLAGTEIAKRIAPNNLEAQQTVGTLTEMLAGFTPLPTPYRDSVLQERLRREQEQQQLAQQQQSGEQLVHALAATGQLAAPALVPAGVANPFARLM